MTPDSYTNLQILNCTELPLYSGVGNDNAGFFNAYQMQHWFDGADFRNPSTQVVGSRSNQTYLLQFQRCVGDEDDGADIQLNVGPDNRKANNVVWLQGRSASNSAHYVQAQTQAPSLENTGPFAFAFMSQGTWPTHSPSGLSWYVAPTLIDMGSPSTDQCLAIIDLQALFGAAAAQVIASQLAVSQPSNADATAYWLNVKQFMDS